MPELLIRYVPLAQLRQWDRNPKPHDIGALIRSIQRYGFQDPPAYDKNLNDGEGGIKEGNGRYEALSQMKADGAKPPDNIKAKNGEWLVPVLYGGDAKNQAEAEAYAIDHNALTVLGGDFGTDWITNLYTEDGLKDVLLDLGKLDALPVSIDGDDLDALIHKPPPEAPEAQVDKAEELLEVWKVERGQVWQVGKHRVMCGDSTDADGARAVVGDDAMSMVWTDPPYGVKYGDKLDSANPMGYRVRGIQNDDLPSDQLESLIRSAFTNAATVCKPGAAIYSACPPGTLLPTAIAAFVGSGFTFRWQLVWEKDQLVLSRADYHFRHENILYGWKDDGPHYFTDDRTQDSIFTIQRPKVSAEHPTMKPPELVAAMVTNSSIVGDGVYDPFCGSGSTLVACEQTGRRGHGIELEPKYVAVTLQRMADMGLEPELTNG